jgi:TRAP-type mannitol/chloroaromatic compound transport system substrate-binding protein
VGAGGIGSGPIITWRLASSFPKGLDTIFGASESLAKRVSDLSGGRFTIRVSPAGEIVPALNVLDAVQQGTVQAGHTSSYYYTGKHPALAFDTGVPFGLTARQQIAWMEQGGGHALIQQILTDFNIVRFQGGNTGAQMGGWFRREVKTLKDLRGLKMRIPGLGGQVMSRLGVNVQVLSGGDIYPALERGAIDATEWVGPYDDEKLGFHRVAKHYYAPGWWEPGAALSFYVNKWEWEKLPALYKDIFKTASAEASQEMLAKYDARNPEALLRIVKSGVSLHEFSQEIMGGAMKESFALYEEEAARNPSYRKVYTAWKRFREDSIQWARACEGIYSSFLYSWR